MGQSSSKATDNKHKSAETPTKLSLDGFSVDSIETPEAKKFVDPRSPYGCRTPLQSLSATNTPITITKQLNLTTDGENLSTPNRFTGSQKNFLQHKLLKNLGYQMFDPRSPTQFINRTPINMEKASLSTDQSFECSLADESIQAIELSDSSMIPCTSNLDIPIDGSVNPVEDDASSLEKFIADLEIDPRSPSVNVERTPIVFKESECTKLNDDIEASIVENVDNNSTPNKHNIFQDDSEPLTLTPVVNSLKLDTTPKTTNNRTPLSCLGNKKARQVNNQKQAITKMPKHPIIFIGQHQNASTPKNRKSLVPFGNNQYSASKIPVFKNSIL